MSEITLRKWTIRCSKLGTPHLIAHTVHNHPHIGTGLYGHSTGIIWLDAERGIAQTLNTLYFLEEPEADVESPEIQELIVKLHPSNVPPEIRQAHANRRPYPNTDFDNDPVRHWFIERWTGLKKGIDYEIDDHGSENAVKTDD